LVLRPRTGDIRALKKAVSYAGRPIGIDEMRDVIGEAAAEAFRRSVR
jgi:hypothetical protein